MTLFADVVAASEAVAAVRRLLRSPRFLIFTAGLPLVYFLIFSGIYAPDGGQAVVVLMVMMAAFGSISAAVVKCSAALALSPVASNACAR